MLSSGKLRVVLLLFAGLFLQHLYADRRYYLILQSGQNFSYSYIGSVTVDDDIQALTAQIFLPGGDIIVLVLDILADGQTVRLQVDPGGRTFPVTPLRAFFMSAFVRALQAGCGNPSEWLADPELTTYQFTLPDIRGIGRIQLNQDVRNQAGGVRMKFNQNFPLEIRNITYSQNRFSLNPGTRTTGRLPGVIGQISDHYLLQLSELMLVALISPQLVQGRLFLPFHERNMGDPVQRLPLVIEISDRVPADKEQRSREKAPEVAVAQGYYLWILEGMQWVFQQYIAGTPPQGFANSPQGSLGVIYTALGPKSCFVQPVVYPVVSEVDPMLADLIQQFGSMNVGVPPENCRNGWYDWHGKGGFGGGSGPGRGDGPGGFIAH